MALRVEKARVVRNLRKLREGSELRREIAAAMFVEAEVNIMTPAKKITPVKTGALRSSGVVDVPQVTRTSISVRMGFGGVAVQYAAVVHENPRKRQFRVGQDHYLSEPFFAAAPGIQERLGQKVFSSIQSTVF